MPNDDSGVEAARLDLLKRIAETLDLPASALYGPGKGGTDRPDAALRDDVRAMLAAFVRIRDPERRRACLGYVTEIMDDDGGAADPIGPDRKG